MGWFDDDILLTEQIDTKEFFIYGAKRMGGQHCLSTRQRVVRQSSSSLVFLR